MTHTHRPKVNVWAVLSNPFLSPDDRKKIRPETVNLETIARVTSRRRWNMWEWIPLENASILEMASAKSPPSHIYGIWSRETTAFRKLAPLDKNCSRHLLISSPRFFMWRLIWFYDRNFQTGMNRGAIRTHPNTNLSRE